MKRSVSIASGQFVAESRPFGPELNRRNGAGPAGGSLVEERNDELA